MSAWEGSAMQAAIEQGPRVQQVPWGEIKGGCYPPPRDESTAAMIARMKVRRDAIRRQLAEAEAQRDELRILDRMIGAAEQGEAGK